MKKRLMALALCGVLMTSLLCINVFAMADKTKVISINNIYDIVYSENPNITMTGNSIYNMSSTANTVQVSYSTGASVLSSKQSQKKIAYNSEQTLLSYYTALNSVKKLETQVKAMERTMAVSKVKYDYGMLSRLDYNSALISQKELQASLLTAKESLKKAKGSLNLLINNTYDDEINIADFESMDMVLLEQLDRDTCYKSAVDNSMDLDASRLSLDGAIISDEISSNQTSANSRENAYISYVQAQRSLDLTFDTQWNTLFQKKDALTLEEISFDEAQKNLELGKIKFQLGMISNNDTKLF
jgi:outer membrane protein TolC